MGGDDADALDQVRLRSALNRYLRARAHARRAPDADPAVLSRARRDLVLLLQDAGWEPPPSVRAALDDDVKSPADPRRRSA